MRASSPLVRRLNAAAITTLTCVLSVALLACGGDGGGAGDPDDAADTAPPYGPPAGTDAIGGGDGEDPDDGDGTPGPDGGETPDPPDGEQRLTNAPPGYATLTTYFDDRANKTFGAQQVIWTGSFSWRSNDNTIVQATSWLPTDGPYPFLWDDGPISAGGHEREGEVAGDHVFTTEVYFKAETTTPFEYGLLNQFGNWMWIGANGSIEIPAGSEAIYDLPGLVLPPFGDVDIKLEVDTNALHELYAGEPVSKVFVKGTHNMWAPVQILDDGNNGDAVAGDGIYTYVHSTKLGPHDGLLQPGQEAQFVYVFTYNPDATAEQGIEYKVAGNAAAEGVRGYTDAEGPGQWEEVEVYLALDSKGNTYNTAIRVPGEMPALECLGDEDCEGGTCESNVCVPDAEEPVPDCTSDADCAGGTCLAGTCVPAAGDGPSILLVEPTSGPSTGGTAVTITGAGFAAGATVSFGAAAATGVDVKSETSLTCTTPAGAVGDVDVRVTVAGKQGVFPKGFTYVDAAAAPVISSVQPSSGGVGGGTPVTLYGQHFASGAIVSFGNASTAATVIHAGELHVTTPAHSEGTVDVRVTNPNNQFGVLPGGYTFAPELPDWATLTGQLAFEAQVGQPAGPVRVEVYEAGVTDGPGSGGVLVEVGVGPPGSDPAGSASWKWWVAEYESDSGNNDIYAGFVVGDAPGAYDVAGRASVDGGQNWLYVDASGTLDGYDPANSATLVVSEAPDEPTIVGVSPKGVSVVGGTTVTITGFQLSAATAVLVGGESVAAQASETSVTFTAPAREAGSVTLEVALAGGTHLTVPDGLRYGLVGTPTLDGGIGAGEWPSAFTLADNATETTWGVGLNELHRLRGSFDAQNLYLAVEGFTEPNNAIVLYVDRDYGAGTGLSNMSALTDNDGVLDAALSGPVVCTAPGFGAELAAGSVGMNSFTMGAPLGGANAAGWRELANPADLAWLDGTVAAGDGALELAVPLSTLFAGPVPASGSAVAVFVRIVSGSGDAYSNQGLPDAVSGEGNVQQGAVSSFEVFPL